MTDNERINKVYQARLKHNKPFINELPLPKHDISVGRKTPKSEFLLELDRKSTKSKYFIEGLSAKIEIDGHSEMVSVYTGSDLNHFHGAK